MLAEIYWTLTVHVIITPFGNDNTPITMVPFRPFFNSIISNLNALSF